MQCAQEATKELLLQLELTQRAREENQGDFTPHLFAVVLDSSGTGKSQLAATCAAEYPGTRYLVMQESTGAEWQQFYRPHVNISYKLFTALNKFQRDNRRLHSATSILSQAKTLRGHLVELLYQILFSEIPKEGATLDTVRQKLKKKREEENQEEVIVFLDEFPRKNDRIFSNCVLFRDVLRAVGCAPIIMSTHSGAQNAAPLNQHSRGVASVWVRIFCKTLQYQPDPVTGNSPFLIDTERPLVATRVESINSLEELSRQVLDMKKYLQAAKPQAWDNKFQLVTLFRSLPESSGKHITHQLVGSHFGHFVPKTDTKLFYPLARSRASGWTENCNVEMVEAGKEPVLFLTLFSWTMEELDQDNEPHFP